MEKSDLLYYLAYILLFIFLGIWLLLWALDVVEKLGDTFLLWLLTAGVLMLVFGMVKTRDAPQGSIMLIASGAVLSVFTLILLAVLSDIIGGWVGASVGIIIIGIVALVILFMMARPREA
jgi:hypothetical protein